MPRPRIGPSKPMPPAVALSVCIARALAERDPKFLAVLRSNVEAFREHCGPMDAATETTRW